MRNLTLLLLISFFSLSSIGQTTLTDSIFFDGGWRNYRLFLPTGFAPLDELPLVINMHGLGSNALEQEIYSGMDMVADTADFVVCYPNGVKNSWNVIGDTVDDIGFIDSLIDHLHLAYNINLNQVYATGMSNGGFMSYLLACELTHRFAAIASVAGTNTTPNQFLCDPSKMIPVLHIHGTADPTVPYGGSIGIVSVDDLMTYWADHNGCDLTPDTVPVPNINTFDQCTAQQIIYTNCDSSMQVILYRVVGGEHTWPGSIIKIGITNMDFNASEVIWQFFNQFPATSTGMEWKREAQNVSIFPNPTQDLVTISGKDQIATGQLFNLNGTLVRSLSTAQLPITVNMANLPSGIYVLQLEMDGSVIQKKIVRLASSP